MKKLLFLTIAVLLIVAMPVGAQIKLGLHGSYSAGGDLEKKDVGIGGQIVVPLSDIFSAELSATRFEDGIEVLKVDVTHIAGTLRLSVPIMYGSGNFYGGAGFSFNQFDASVDLPGFFVDIDDVFGFHAAAGLNMMLTDKVELFGEYRYVWAKSAAEVKGPQATEVVKGDYNFGLFRIGLNFVF